jgi:glutaminase
VTTARSSIDEYLARLHERFRALTDGAVATYIPELGKSDPNAFGVCLATMDGHVYAVGDADVPFTIQSISKPFVYGLALEDRGKAGVLKHIGVEPTGEAFNEISLEAGGRPRNPLINAGAITATSLVAGHSPEDRWARILALFELYAGRTLALDDAVFHSERETGHRNRAIGHMLRNFGILAEAPDTPLDLYFRQCSILVTCRDLARMAATLASAGVNPLTGERALSAENIDEVLSVMTTCGMYDSAGEWMYRVGFPAKSGVGGGILGVLPGKFGIAVYSPPLDAHGNSVRGVAVCEAISSELELHSLRAARAALSAVRSRFDLRSVHSTRLRSEAEYEALRTLGAGAVVLQLQGDLDFAAIERVARDLAALPAELHCLVIDLTGVRDVAPVAARFLCSALGGAHARGIAIGFVGLARHSGLARALGEDAAAGVLPHFPQHASLDSALEWCERRLLAAAPALAVADEIALASHEALRSLASEDLQRVCAIAERRAFAARELVVREGDDAHELFLLVAGRVSVLATDRHGEPRRLATLLPGMSFGESAFVNGGKRTALVRADEPSVCFVLHRDAIAAASAERPQLLAALIGSLLDSALRVVARLTRERAEARTAG